MINIKQKRINSPWTKERHKKMAIIHSSPEYFDICEMCGKSGLKGRQIQWANIDHKYRRVLDDYIHMCAKCHGEYDRIHNLRKH